MKKILIIQTAFIGDVILATSLVEKVKFLFPEASIDFLLRKGTEGLFEKHPLIRNVIILDKSGKKLRKLFSVLKIVRKQKYDLIINAHRFGSSGLITAFSGAKKKIGFDKNPFSMFFSIRVKHEFGSKEKPLHETERNLKLLDFTGNKDYFKPKLYISDSNIKKVSPFIKGKYICIAPASVWFTKQFPESKWVEFIQKIPSEFHIILIGAKNESDLCERLIQNAGNPNVINLAGKLDLLDTAALIKNARMNFVNDSAAMHIASAMDAPVTAIYCSTVPEFGFGPLSQQSFIVQTTEQLACKPCGLHGFRECPQKHFKCGFLINIDNLLKKIS